MNSLTRERSPYLLQHKDNPVEWHVWNAETLAKARALDKPILLSIGYSACHWCHVMARESFEDAKTAALMNELFIPVKVDREERPDVDAIYQKALGLMGHHGGWPLTGFLTPAGDMYWGGTYYPPEPRHGRLAFADVLVRAADAYRNKKASVEKNTRTLAERMARLADHPEGTLLTQALVNETCAGIAALMDPVEGGLGMQAPKFPNAPVLTFLWRGYKRTGNTAWRDAVLLTLTHMSQGGIYDHLGGGYARYATDTGWLVPHFEKMLYDNAQLVELLIWAWLETRNPLFADRVWETATWVLREMRLAGGAFAAAIDADSEHQEGKYYVWTAAEIEDVLGDEAPLFKSRYDVHRFGNWDGKCILNRSERPHLGDGQTELRLAAARFKLWTRRELRVPPALDHKVLADWNGLMISALCLASEVFDNAAWLIAAVEAFEFVRTRMTDGGGRLSHSWCDGRSHPGLVEDYAAMSRAALSLYQATGDVDFLQDAKDWAEILDAEFHDDAGGGYFTTSQGTSDVILRLRNAHDHAMPSGNAMMVEVLATLWCITGRDEYRQRATRLIGAFAGDVARNPVAMAGFMSSVCFLLDGVRIVLCRGEGYDALAEVIHQCATPNRVVTLRQEWEPYPAGHPAANKSGIGGKAAAYVCKGEVCSMPMTTPGGLAALLKDLTQA